ncbi:sensor of ECF-type sigma factor [Flavobacterium luminosum]|uniref:Sensor of ECF-type sigma factor n=1 Tax=Flavobacterium luminosum TaxID=2949086 RepID=A0ABT0TMI9_9FLAO|nr:sensor of ECF-type sigma factor [Flavobacterium sp. HXWNR70]MCL9808700.1 sensor of ECF-type sigma factor [Flavobacterium sp. HXWNR70]
MKNIYTLLFLLFSILGFSQDTEERIERIKALRIAFISEKLELTPEEAQQFWPIFNQFDDRQSKLQREKRKLMRNLRPGNTMNLSEKETAKLMEEDERLENEIQNNRRQLVKDLQGVIPNRKILMLRQIDIEFKQKLLQQIQKRQERRYKR